MARVAFIVTTCHEVEGVLDWKPDVVGIYATTGQEAWCYDFIRGWKKELRHLKVVMGGPHPSHDLEPLAHADVVDATIKGEGEYAMLALVNAWEAARSIAALPHTASL